MTNIWVRKPLSVLLAEAEEPEVQALTTHDGVPLKRTLSAINLVALGIGAIIGAGIFVLTGHAAAANAGPADHAVVRARRHRLRLCRPVLRRDGLDRPDRRQRLYLRLRDLGRNRRLDHRLGPDPRICARRGHRRDRLVGLRRELLEECRHRRARRIRQRAVLLRRHRARLARDRRDHQRAGDAGDRLPFPPCWSSASANRHASTTSSSPSSS